MKQQQHPEAVQNARSDSSHSVRHSFKGYSFSRFRTASLLFSVELHFLHISYSIFIHVRGFSYAALRSSSLLFVPSAPLAIPCRTRPWRSNIQYLLRPEHKYYVCKRNFDSLICIASTVGHRCTLLYYQYIIIRYRRYLMTHMELSLRPLHITSWPILKQTHVYNKMSRYVDLPPVI